MKNKLILKILSCIVAGAGVLSFVGCGNKDSGNQGSTEPPVAEGPDIIGGEQGGTEQGGTEQGGTEQGGTEQGGTEQGGTEQKPEDEEKPVEGAVKIIKAQGDLEAAYVTWEIDENAKWYNVYIKASKDSSYSTKLDAPLVRKYSTYFRADAVGLKEGTYDFKVVPVDATTEQEAQEFASEEKNISVKAHMRVGFAFVGGTSSGAYNEDGTLKSNAEVLYITEKTKDTVSMNVTGANANPCVGLQAILTGYGKGKEEKPLAIRLVGNITKLAQMEKGDIVISNKTNKNYAGSGITFEGIGSDATVNGWGVRVKDARNIEIRNLGFMNTSANEPDNVGLQQDNDHIWVHNCDMFYGGPGGANDQAKGDGALDTKLSTNVTHSFNHFWDSGKCNLQGMKGEVEENCITYHHNWYDHSDSRHPRIRTCTVHIFNNYFDGNAKYGVGVTYGASAFVENNYFRSTVTMHPMLISAQGTDAEGAGTFSGEDGGIIKAFGNKFDGPKALKEYSSTNTVEFDCYTAKTRDEQVPSSVTAKQGGTKYNNFDTASNMYSYEVETPDEAKATVQKYAGRIDGGDLKFTFDNSKDDADYSVNQALKQMLTGYKTDVKEIGGIGDVSNVGGGSTGGGSTGGDNTGGEDNPSTPPAVEGVVTCSFLGGQPSDTTGIFKVSSSTASKSSTVTVLGTQYKTGIKMDGNGELIITVDCECTVTLYVLNERTFELDGVRTSAPTDSSEANTDCKVITLQLKAGTHSIKKGSGENAIYYAILTPVE